MAAVAKVFRHMGAGAPHYENRSQTWIAAEQRISLAGNQTHLTQNPYVGCGVSRSPIGNSKRLSSLWRGYIYICRQNTCILLVGVDKWAHP